MVISRTQGDKRPTFVSVNYANAENECLHWHSLLSSIVPLWQRISHSFRKKASAVSSAVRRLCRMIEILMLFVTAWLFFRSLFPLFFFSSSFCFNHKNLHFYWVTHWCGSIRWSATSFPSSPLLPSVFVFSLFCIVFHSSQKCFPSKQLRKSRNADAVVFAFARLLLSRHTISQWKLTPMKYIIFFWFGICAGAMNCVCYAHTVYAPIK